MTKKKIVVFGYGQRGSVYAEYATTYREEYELVAIIERDENRIALAKKRCGNVPVYTDYRQFIQEKIAADIVVVSTQDEQHPEHAIAMMQAGYDLLLEKPIATCREDCIKIYETAQKYNRRVVVCHVLRYTPFYSTIKRIIDSGEAGEIVTINASENVGYYHQAHSYVRGPWRNSRTSSPMILAKCCHDLDILRYLIGEPCKSVSSYGGLYYFNEEHAPEGHARYCSECKYSDCIYKAQTLYTSPGKDWFANYFTTKEHTRENILQDLKYTQYDRCVYACDNDVVDHQVVNAQFAHGKTASLTMTAFSSFTYRDIKVHGTKAEIYGVLDGSEIQIRYFGKDWKRVPAEVPSNIPDGLKGHSGGDFAIMKDLFLYLNGEKTEGISLLDVSLESHLMCFAAEQSRQRQGEVQAIEK